MSEKTKCEYKVCQIQQPCSIYIKKKKHPSILVCFCWVTSIRITYWVWGKGQCWRFYGGQDEDEHTHVPTTPLGPPWFLTLVNVSTLPNSGLWGKADSRLVTGKLVNVQISLMHDLQQSFVMQKVKKDVLLSTQFQLYTTATFTAKTHPYDLSWCTCF